MEKKPVVQAIRESSHSAALLNQQMLWSDQDTGSRPKGWPRAEEFTKLGLSPSQEVTFRRFLAVFGTPVDAPMPEIEEKVPEWQHFHETVPPVQPLPGETPWDSLVLRRSLTEEQEEAFQDFIESNGFPWDSTPLPVLELLLYRFEKESPSV